MKFFETLANRSYENFMSQSKEKWWPGHMSAFRGDH